MHAAYIMRGVSIICRSVKSDLSGLEKVMKNIHGVRLWVQGIFCAAAVFFLCSPVECLADLKSSDAFRNTEWTLLTEYEIGNNTANLQSVCSTDTYIVCLINSSNEEMLPDKLVAFYKGGSDAQGNPVTPYSVALEVEEKDYEHGNGMAYNPGTHEIIIAGGKNLDPANKGCLFIVDADTLKFKRKVKISDQWNVHAIDYSVNDDTYLIQKGGAGGYDFIETDADFNTIREIDNMVEVGAGGTFQDLCVCGDDLVTLPYDGDKEYNGNIQIYSRKEQKLLGEYQMNISSDSEVVEAESISELSPGSFVLGCAIRNPRRIALYGATLPMAYNVHTSIDNGKITKSIEGADLGSDCEITYQPEENYEVKEITVDGENISVEENEAGYTFRSITQDHTIHVKCTEIPLFEISAEAKNGVVEQSQMIRRDKDVTVYFEPDEHHELDYVLVDGEPVSPDEEGNSVTLKNIQQAHHIQVFFSEIPAFMITAEVKNGEISDKVCRVYRDENCTVTFKGDKDYELYRVYVDGKELEQLPESEGYTFEQVQTHHDIQVYYRWKYSNLFWFAAGGLLSLLVWYLLLVWKRRRRMRMAQVERNIWKDEMKEVRGEDEE